MHRNLPRLCSIKHLCQDAIISFSCSSVVSSSCSVVLAAENVVTLTNSKKEPALIENEGLIVAQQFIFRKELLENTDLLNFDSV